MNPICRHCTKSKVNRPRGLCWSCYYTPGVKELYPSTSKYARRGIGNFTGKAPLPAAAGFFEQQGPRRGGVRGLTEQAGRGECPATA